MFVSLLAIVLIAGGVWSTGAQAEVLRLDEVTAQSQNAGLRPARGMSMSGVEERYGPPVDKFAPVGDPPITRWEYQTFIVYFENQTVIHAVDKRSTSS